jgi:hypothetical protein
MAPLNGQFQPWLVRANMDANGHQILSAEKLLALHRAVMKACADAHGVIRDPRACTFDPASIRCPSGMDNVNCLTAAQVQVIHKVYRGPTDPQAQPVRRWRALRLRTGLEALVRQPGSRPAGTGGHDCREDRPQLPEVPGVLEQPAGKLWPARCPVHRCDVPAARDPRRHLQRDRSRPACL